MNLNHSNSGTENRKRAKKQSTHQSHILCSLYPVVSLSLSLRMPLKHSLITSVSSSILAPSACSSASNVSKELFPDVWSVNKDRRSTMRKRQMERNSPLHPIFSEIYPHICLHFLHWGQIELKRHEQCKSKTKKQTPRTNLDINNYTITWEEKLWAHVMSPADKSSGAHGGHYLMPLLSTPSIWPSLSQIWLTPDPGRKQRGWHTAVHKKALPGLTGSCVRQASDHMSHSAQK